MATANPTEVSSAPVHKDEKYERIVLEPQPNMETEIEEAKELLDLALCSVPNEDDEKYEEEGNEGLYEKDLEEIATRTKKLLHKDFPYTAYVPSDETVLEKPIFKDYTGNSRRLRMSSLKCLKCYFREQFSNVVFAQALCTGTTVAGTL